MDLIKPELGLIFWTVIVFGLVLLILAKYAWHPILNALQEREQSIEEALRKAEKAKEDMAALTADNERVLNEAKEERALMLKEAKGIKEDIISEAKEKAKAEASKLSRMLRRRSRIGKWQQSRK